MRQFYAAHHERLRRFVRHRTGHGGGRDAEDVCQEIWLVFFANYDAHVAKYDNLAKVLFPIARCRIAEYWRKHGRTHETPVEATNLGALADALRCVEGEAVFERAVRRIDVERALACLTERQLDTLHLLYVDGLTVGEVAPLMGISENTVKKFRTVACDKLRKSEQLDGYRARPRPEEVGE
ncbi:RNA polymerase sigma factor [Streptomyces sp. NPDC001410]|uniref:RNA polymerase sigma factor n=1 Tax=Streptomyces sp. NPDC001410 TaxID=3364574 RepID=UPI0036B93A10